MWRFFRLGIKSGTCPGNHPHFRIIGTTCTNADCDDITEELNTVNSNEHRLIGKNENIVSKATKNFQNYLQNQENIAQKKVQQYEFKKVKAPHKPLREVNWKKYVSGKEDCSHISVKSLQNKLLNDSSSDVSESKPVYNDEEFGSLSKSSREFELLPEEKDDAEVEVFVSKLSQQEYGKKMLQLCQERKLKEALEVLEVEMKNVGVVPNHYCYNVLINACGKIGYTKKAFELYYQLKRRGMFPQKFVYTGLFNACANSPYGNTEGLDLATTLRKQLKDMEILLHPITYHAMIKAFGRCGDIMTSFEIVDEMVSVGHAVKTETLNFLLQACISDKETGFRHALMVWRKMRTLLLTPDLYSYNLLLRCVKECGAGDPRLLDQLFSDASESQKLKGRLKKLKETTIKSLKASQSYLEGQKTDSKKTIASQTKEEKGAVNGERNIFYQVGDKNEIVKVNLEENMEMELVNRDVNQLEERKEVLPNMLAYKADPGSIVSITSLEKRDERLWLLGGVSGVLESMKEDKVMPITATFTCILESLPPQKEVEEMLLTTMKNLNVKPDIYFFNKLIYKRNMRDDYTDAADVLDLMQKHSVCVDLISFGCLALGCKKPSQISQFLRDMNKAGFTPNIEIMETLLQNCLKRSEFAYAIDLLQKSRSYEIVPSENMLKLLEKARDIIKQRFIKQENGEEAKKTPWEQRKQEEMRLFLMEYKYWLKNSRVNFKDHPWAQFGHQDRGKEVVRQTSM